MEKPQNRPLQASETKTGKPHGGAANGHAIPAKFSKAPLFHTHRKRDKERLVNASTPTTPTPSPPHVKSSSSTPTRAVPRVKPSVAAAGEDVDAKAASSAFSGPFQEFRLMSSNLNGWKYDVMKLESRKPVDVELWQHPIKLNRKDPKRDWEVNEVSVVPQAVGPMLGLDGKPVIGADGRMVMVDADGRPIHGNSGESSNGSKFGKEKAVGGRKKFQKKTKQVFLVPEATRMLRKEERYPWVMEDGTGSQVWIGMLEDLNRAETHAMFLPTAENVFKFVPPHRWYKFQKKPSHKIPTLEEAEKLMAQFQKQKNPEQWLASRGKVNHNADASGSGVKSEETVNSHIPSSVSLVHSSSQSLGPGGRKLKSVDSGMGGLFGDEDDEETGFKRKREKEYGGDGDADEMDFEEDFADDEEKNPEEAEDDEAKELEERIKKEYRKANTTNQTDFVEDSDEDEEQQLTGAGKAMQKVLRKTDKSGHYDDSDEEKNPYASSEEEEEEAEPTQTWTGPAIQAPPPRPGSERPSVPLGPAVNGGDDKATQQTGTNAGSRATSPTLASGHLVVAQRATSPKAPKGAKTSRASSPLAHSAGQTSSRATSPSGSVSRAGSPTGSGGSAKANGNKRKAGEEMPSASSPSGTNGQPKTKKRKGPTGVATGEMDDKMVIEWLRNTPNATTRDCIHHFTPYLTDETKKSRFTALIKELAQLKGGVLVLRNAYRGTSPHGGEGGHGGKAV